MREEGVWSEGVKDEGLRTRLHPGLETRAIFHLIRMKQAPNT